MTFVKQMLNSGVKPLDGYVSFKDWRACQRKRRYATFELAQVVEQSTLHGVAYKCERCFGFHVGHKTEVK